MFGSRYYEADNTNGHHNAGRQQIVRGGRVAQVVLADAAHNGEGLVHVGTAGECLSGVTVAKLICGYHETFAKGVVQVTEEVLCEVDGKFRQKQLVFS